MYFCWELRIGNTTAINAVQGMGETLEKIIIIKNSLNLERVVFTDPLWIKNFSKIALCHTVFEIQSFFVFCNCCEKFKIATTFDGTNFFSKVG